MNEHATSDQTLSPTKQALLKIRELKQQLAEAQQIRQEAIAIVSMACRFPRRSATPEAFWENLLQGTNEVSEIPADRWDLDAYFDEDPDAPGKMYARQGVFLDGLDLMDPDFFGISPREATWVDPQQRLLLEVSWETLERAGWSPDRIKEETSLFIGWMHNDYQNESSDSLLNLNPYIATGSAGSFLCGRLSYYLGLHGPSLAVDTACSSSLVALHLACQSLQQGECSRALVGGVNAIVSPTTNILTCKLRALSPNGHSLAFDARADGYLRGEGCGVVALRRLSDAQRDGDPILAVIRGSAINHNGFSSGLTAPNPKAQERVIRAALAEAGIQPSQVDYLEAHGTGTELGDPIEMRAAAAVLGTDRDPDSPLLVGSVKTNIGHLEAAAGMAGLIKVLLALQHGRIPAHQNFQTPNPHIPWDELPVKIVTEATEWPSGERSIAGVSAFGMSGTNAHVVLEKAPPLNTATSLGAAPVSSPAQPSYHLLTLSGKTDDVVRQLAGRYRSWLATHPDANLADVCHTAGAGRRHFERRAAMVVQDLDEAQRRLEALERSGEAPFLFVGEHRTEPQVAWQFTGQGSQYVGMAKQLYESQPVFRDAVDECDEQLRELREGSLTNVMFSDPNLVDHTHWTQPCLFALQKGLVKFLESWGYSPDILLGHSVGQYAAACAAGIMSWEDGLRLISERGRLIGALPAGGTMAAVFTSAEQLESVIRNHGDVSIAAYNGSHIVISGPVAPIDAAVAELQSRNLRCKTLNTSHAFHSSLMDPALAEFERIADEIVYHAPLVPLVCNVSGQVLDVDTVVDGKYWRQHIRQPVRFAESVAALQQYNCDAVLELGPRPVLTRMAAAAWTGNAPALISTLDPDHDDQASLLAALGQLHVRGATADFAAQPNGTSRRVVNLPTYPFQRRRFWGPPKPQAYSSEMHTSHPLLGARKPLANSRDETRYENYLAPDHPHWLEHHKVMDDVVFPGAAYVETALAAGKTNLLSDVTFESPLRISKRVCLQTIVKSGEENRKTAEIHSALPPYSHWSRNLTATLGDQTGERPDRVNRQEIANRCEQVVDPGQFYEMLNNFGLQYGSEFRTIQTLNYSDTEVLAKLQLNEDVRGYTIPPMLLDGAFQSLAIGLMRDENASLFLPAGVGRVEVYDSIGATIWSHAQWDQFEGEVRTANLTLMDENGEVLARVEQLKLRQLNRAALRRISGSGPQRLLHEVQWRGSHLQDMNLKESGWLVVGAPEHTDELATALESRGQQCLRVNVTGRSEPVEQSDSRFRIDAHNSHHWQAVIDHWEELHAGTMPQGVVWTTGDQSCPQCTIDEIFENTRVHCGGILQLLHILRERSVRRLDRGFQIITRSGVKAVDTDGVNAHASQYWGLGRGIGAEQPDLRCRLIDTEGCEGEAEIVADVLLSDSPESQLALRRGQLHVPRLLSCKLPESNAPFTVSEDGSYLVTGGLGMLGRAAARWLATRGAGHVVLVSRRRPSESMQLVIDEIEAAGCRIHVQQADVGDPKSVQELMKRFGHDLPPLKGLIHAAGVLDDGLLADQTWERFHTVLAPKVRGAWELHQATRNMNLDFFVLYSSAASVLGSPGQSNYATANAFLDGLAHHRAAESLPGLSVNWGPWTEGMADNDLIVRRMALQGITPLTTAESHQALERLLQAQISQATVLDVDWSRMRMGLGGESPPLFEELTPAAASMSLGASALVERLRSLQQPARKRLLNETVQGELQEILSTPDLPDPDTPLNELGLDSLMAVEFSTRLQQQLGADLAIAPTLLFDYPTVNALTDYLLDLLSELSDSEPSEPQETTPTASDVERDAVAIVGMSCRFPGAQDLAEFWDNLLQGVDAVSEIPHDRWNVDDFYDPIPTPGKMYTREGGFLSDVADFDADFFGIAAQEACWIDPQHRLLLETSWQAFENAGISSHPLQDANVGVFVGIMSQDYNQLHVTDDVDVIDSFQGAGLSHSAGVGRLSYLFGFEGPSVAIDTASSSSLVAVSQAAKCLLEGDCNMAFAGGVNAILTPGNSLLLSKAKILSPDGRCKSFSAAADGFGRGEGCGVVVLKRLSDAERDGDRILAVIRGSAVCHNGFSGGLTTPSGRAQERVIREALEDAELQPSDVDYLEAHGTGTEYGDPIEIAAAASVLGKGRSSDRPLLVGSVKPNIGHLEAAGGISGLIKAVLAMHDGVIPKQIHFDQPSPHIPWPRLPIKIVTETTTWPDGEQRVAGVSAFGMSGTNAHVVLSYNERHQETHEQESTPNHQLLVLSSKHPRALKILASRYADCLEQSPEQRLADVCFTAAVGRRHFEQRLAIVAESLEDAQRKLEAFANSGETTQRTSKSSPKTAWLFSGIEGHTQRTGRKLYETQPVFRKTIEQLSDIARAEQVPSLQDTLFSNEQTPLPPSAMFSLQLALSNMWQSWGIEPDIVFGVGIGEYAAACVAGVMSSEEGLKLTFARDQLLLAATENDGVADEALDQFERLADTLDYFPANRPLISSLDGQIVPVHRLLGGSYWRRHCTDAIAFESSMHVLASMNVDIVMQMGPGDVRSHEIHSNWSDTPPRFVQTMSTTADEWTIALNAAGQLYEAGCTLDFSELYRASPHRKIQLPTYPFHRQRYWLTDVAEHAPHRV